MTKDKFQQVCEQVLIPRLADLLGRELTDVRESLDVTARELVRIGARIDSIAKRLNERNPHEGNR